jgi:hypothetical protein
VKISVAGAEGGEARGRERMHGMGVVGLVGLAIVKADWWGGGLADFEDEAAWVDVWVVGFGGGCLGRGMVCKRFCGGVAGYVVVRSFGIYGFQVLAYAPRLVNFMG